MPATAQFLDQNRKDVLSGEEALIPKKGIEEFPSVSMGKRIRAVILGEEILDRIAPVAADQEDPFLSRDEEKEKRFSQKRKLCKNIRRALQKLPLEERRVLNMLFDQDMEEKEVRKTLRISKNQFQRLFNSAKLNFVEAFFQNPR